jgi:hypothetical protein
MKSLYFLILLVTTSSIHASEKACVEEVVDLGSLKENQAILIPFYKEKEIRIYKRNDNQVSKSIKANKSEFDTIAPAWWSNKELLDTNIAITTTRSISERYFIYYNYSPIQGHYLMYFSESKSAKDQYPFLGSDWEGGFVDVVNEVAYDFTGRPIYTNLKASSSEAIKSLAKLSLLIPKHEFINNGASVKLLCN